MTKQSAPLLSPIAFLQSFVVQSLRAAGQLGCAQCDDGFGYIEHIGLTAGPCLEATCRQQMGLEGPIDLDQYADIILSIKNQIGGNFSRASSDAGMVRVINTRCPFGEAVKEVPDLCRMTSSVFGGIAARNFGYARVELNRRISNGDDVCEVCIDTDPEGSRDLPGDEYRNDNGDIVSGSACSELRVRVEKKIQKTWCVAAKDADARRAKAPKVIAESKAMGQALEAARCWESGHGSR